MTTTSVPAPSADVVHPPYSRLVQRAAGACLVLAGLLNGLTQYVGSQLTGDLDFSEQIVWGAAHEAAHTTEQTLLVVSALFLPLGLLGLAQVTRWRARRLTLVGVPLMLWGMWGFHNVLAMGYVSGTVAPTVLPVSDAVALNDGLVDHVGVLVTALLPHLLGSFLGVLLLTVAAWRSGFARPACAAVLVFLVWDFLLPTSGPLEPHLLLAVGWSWLGIQLLRLPARTWRTGATA
jgi:hypothetical protein